MQITQHSRDVSSDCVVLACSLLTSHNARLGSINVLCSDKTGTLTSGQMTVVSCYMLGDEFSPLQGRDRLVGSSSQATNARLLGILSSVCNGARYTTGISMNNPAAIRQTAGDATDSAILRFSDILCDSDTSRAHFSNVYTQSFSSATKYMIKIVSHGEFITQAEAEALPTQEGSYIMLVKGAPDVLMKRSTRVFDPTTGQSEVLTPERLQAIVDVQEKWANNGQRVLLLARKHIALSQTLLADAAALADHVSANNLDLEIIGLLGIIDPPREGVPEAVSVCRQAGVRVYMVTGDFKGTAAAIAQQCGILTDARRVDGLTDLNTAEADNKSIQDDPHAEKHITIQRRSLVLDGSDLMKTSDGHWDLIKSVCGWLGSQRNLTMTSLIAITKK